MKINKDQQRLLEKHINQVVKATGWHKNKGTVYKVIGENFIHANYIIINSQKLVFDVWIKKYNYDDLFWTIIDMTDNINKNESLRAVAAFKSPSILIEDSEFKLTDDTQELAEKFMNAITEAVENFIKKHDVAEYIFEKSSDFFYNGEVLKCIAYIDKQEYSCAEEIARKSIEDGDHDGGFENKGKGFFDYMLSYIKKEKRRKANRSFKLIRNSNEKCCEDNYTTKGIFKNFFKSKKAQNVFSGDRADFYWERAVDEYCKINNKKRGDSDFGALSEYEEDVIWEYAGNHIALFLIWLIQNGFYNGELTDDENINLLMDEKISGTDFLINSCDGKLWRCDISDEIIGFVDEYYNNKYFDEYCLFIEREIKGVVLGTRFSWEIYHKFTPIIDNAYKEYQQRNE